MSNAIAIIEKTKPTNQVITSENEKVKTKEIKFKLLN